jgi:hypothetical protein
MTNFLFSSRAKLGLTVLLTAAFLQGCGAERTTPFNPDLSSSSSSAAAVTTQLIRQGTATSMVLDYSDKRLQVMREDDEYYDLTDYYDTSGWPSQNFDNGQVVLIDLGEQDSCKQRLEFSSLRAEDAGTEGVKVVVGYRALAAVSTACTSVKTRPYYIYYVESRDALIFGETIQ